MACRSIASKFKVALPVPLAKILSNVGEAVKCLNPEGSSPIFDHSTSTGTASVMGTSKAGTENGSA